MFRHTGSNFEHCLWWSYFTFGIPYCKEGEHAEVSNLSRCYEDSNRGSLESSADYLRAAPYTGWGNIASLYIMGKLWRSQSRQCSTMGVFQEQGPLPSQELSVLPGNNKSNLSLWKDNGRVNLFPTKKKAQRPASALRNWSGPLMQNKSTAVVLLYFFRFRRAWAWANVPQASRVKKGKGIGQHMRITLPSFIMLIQRRQRRSLRCQTRVYAGDATTRSSGERNIGNTSHWRSPQCVIIVMKRTSKQRITRLVAHAHRLRKSARRA